MKKRAQKKIVTIILIFFIVIVVAVIIFNIGKPSLKEGLEGELEAKKAGKAGKGSGEIPGPPEIPGASPDYCDPDCDWCEEECVQTLSLGSDVYVCEDSGMHICSDDYSRCEKDVPPPNFSDSPELTPPSLMPPTTDPCKCDEKCETCVEECEWTGSPDYECEDTGKTLCNSIGPCVMDPKHCDCDEEDTQSGCDYCVESCGFDLTTGELGCVSSGNEICPSGFCHPAGECPESCNNPPCDDLCTKKCKDGECISSYRKRCPDGRCIPSNEKCFSVEI